MPPTTQKIRTIAPKINLRKGSSFARMKSGRGMIPKLNVPKRYARLEARDTGTPLRLGAVGGFANGFAHGGVGLEVFELVEVEDAEVAGAEGFGHGLGD